MVESALVLVDTSVWIRFFRVATSPEAVVLDTLLAVGPVATCAPIRAEVVSGAPTTAQFQRLRTLFGALIQLDPPPDLWPTLEEHRFTLARRGYQASLVDLMIALTASLHHVPLWTLDEDFKPIATVMPLRWYHPHAVR